MYVLHYLHCNCNEVLVKNLSAAGNIVGTVSFLTTCVGMSLLCCYVCHGH